MASKYEQLHFILFPLMAQGHAIPMTDMGKLLAQRGASVTIITTPLNATRYKPIISQATDSGLNLRIHLLQFPSTEDTGLPQGCENFDTLPSLGLGMKFFKALYGFQPQFEEYLKEVEPRPSCIISDMCIPVARESARKFGIPNIIFNGPGCFPMLCSYYVFESKILENVSSDSEPFSVPGLPDQIKFMKKQLVGSTGQDSEERKGFFKKIMDSEKEAYGIVVNSFKELEPEFVENFKKVKTTKVWCVGPVSLCNKENLDKAQRGKKTSIDENHCLEWLDSWPPSSVVYVCLGSLNNLTPSQMMELGLCLESSNRPFIWVIRQNDNAKEVKKLIQEQGFEEKIKGRGLLIWGWAPQILILSHPSVGAFLTHCGWNSTLEGVTAGVPFITWPLFGDQFYNERLVVQLLGIGVSIGVEVCMKWGGEEEIGVVVRKEDVQRAVDCVMEEGEEGEERRRKAKELGCMAKKAMEEGGSSYLGLTQLIEDIYHTTMNNHSM